MIYSKEVDNMCVVAKGPNHGPAPIPEEGKWIQAKEIKDISGYTHGVGWCAPQQGAPELSSLGRVHEQQLPVLHRQPVVNHHLHPLSKLPELDTHKIGRAHV